MSATILVHEMDGSTTCYISSAPSDALHALAEEYLESFNINSADPIRDAFAIADEDTRRDRFPNATDPDETFAEFAELEDSTLIELFPHE